jgi:hypothetical protein
VGQRVRIRRSPEDVEAAAREQADRDQAEGAIQAAYAEALADQKDRERRYAEAEAQARGWSGLNRGLSRQANCTEPAQQEEVMEKQNVIINGVTLSREQIEAAVKELNTPVVQQPYQYPRTLRLKNNPTVEFVVPSGPVRVAVDRSNTLFGLPSNEAPQDQQTLICSKGNGSSGYTAGGAYRVWLPKLEVVS